MRIYREYIQPDERAHQQLGQRLLAKYATTPELQRVARETPSAKVLEIAAAATREGRRADGHRLLPGLLKRWSLLGSRPQDASTLSAEPLARPLSTSHSPIVNSKKKMGPP